MKIVIASDHAGRCLKKTIFTYLKKSAHEVSDMGVDESVEKADYPDFAHLVAEKVTGGSYDFGILICGSGIGMAMAANRISGARAVNCSNEYMAKLSRKHNNANILALGERIIGEGLALAIVEAFLSSQFEGGRHQNRIDKF